MRTYLYIKPLRCNFKTVVTGFVFLLAQMQINAQVKNYGALHVFAGQNIKLNTSFNNASTASYINDGTVYITGDFINDQASMAAGSGTTEFNGTSVQNIDGSEAAAFNHFNVNNTAGAINLLANAAVNGVLTFATGKIQTNNFNVLMPFNASVSGADQNTGWIFGNLQKDVETGPIISKTFEVGDNSNYTPASADLYDVTAAGSLLANVTGTDHPNLASSEIIVNKSVNRYWTITNNATGFNSAAVTFNWVPSDVDAGANTNKFKLDEFTGGAWSLYAAASSTPASLQATGLTSFGDFAMGESSCILPAKPGQVTGRQMNLCVGGIHDYSINPVPGATSYTWNVPADITLTNDLGTSVTLNVPPGIIHDQIFITANSSCGTGVAKIFNLWGKPKKAIITGPSTVTANQTADYTISDIQTGTTYTWKVGPPSATIISGQGTPTVTIKWGTGSGTVFAKASNDCDSSGRAGYFVTVVSGFAHTNSNALNAKQMIAVYPNPTKSEAKLTFNAIKESKYVIELTDVTGKILLHKEINANAGNNEVNLNVSMYASGLYFINLINEKEIKNLKLVKEK